MKSNFETNPPILQSTSTNQCFIPPRVWGPSVRTRSRGRAIGNPVLGCIPDYSRKFEICFYFCVDMLTYVCICTISLQYFNCIIHVGITFCFKIRTETGWAIPDGKPKLDHKLAIPRGTVPHALRQIRLHMFAFWFFEPTRPTIFLSQPIQTSDFI